MPLLCDRKTPRHPGSREQSWLPRASLLSLSLPALTLSGFDASDPVQAPHTLTRLFPRCPLESCVAAPLSPGGSVTSRATSRLRAQLTRFLLPGTPPLLHPLTKPLTKPASPPRLSPRTTPLRSFLCPPRLPASAGSEHHGAHGHAPAGPHTPCTSLAEQRCGGLLLNGSTLLPRGPPSQDSP